jgi:glycosyltransferase involved in cell wall biosynthesis
MRSLVWQWGRRGAGPRFAAELAAALRFQGETALSLSEQAEILRGQEPPACALPVPTYQGLPGLLARLVRAPLTIRALTRRILALAPEVAICAMPAPLDLVMAAALRRARVRYFVIVHDADPHPGDRVPFQPALQRRLIAGAAGIITLSDAVAARLRQSGAAGGKPVLCSSHPPFAFGPPPPPPRAAGGPWRLLCFGRLLPYKGLDLLAEAIAHLGARPDLVLRVVGQGPESPALDRLRRLPGVTVENRWIPEPELPALLAWADAVVLSHREASQSGVAAAAIAANRFLVATAVGGLAEQVRRYPRGILAPPEPAALAAALAGLLGTGPLGTGPLGTGPLATGPLGTGPLGTGPLATGLLATGLLATGPFPAVSGRDPATEWRDTAAKLAADITLALSGQAVLEG